MSVGRSAIVTRVTGPRSPSAARKPVRASRMLGIAGSAATLLSTSSAMCIGPVARATRSTSRAHAVFAHHDVGRGELGHRLAGSPIHHADKGHPLPRLRVEQDGPQQGRGRANREESPDEVSHAEPEEASIVLGVGAAVAENRSAAGLHWTGGDDARRPHAAHHRPAQHHRPGVRLRDCSRLRRRLLARPRPGHHAVVLAAGLRGWAGRRHPQRRAHHARGEPAGPATGGRPARLQPPAHDGGRRG